MVDNVEVCNYGMVEQCEMFIVRFLEGKLLKVAGPTRIEDMRGCMDRRELLILGKSGTSMWPPCKYELRQPLVCAKL